MTVKISAYEYLRRKSHIIAIWSYGSDMTFLLPHLNMHTYNCACVGVRVMMCVRVCMYVVLLPNPFVVKFNQAFNAKVERQRT